MLAGVFLAQKKDNSIYYRSSITYKSKHISLGSYEDELSAHQAYLIASELIFQKKHFAPDPFFEIEHHLRFASAIPFDKWVMLINLRDNAMYCKTPVYLCHRYFIYYFDTATHFKFDVDDLFYYTSHKIMRRGGHLFVSDYGMQINILSRYGIKNHAVPGRDYIFANGDTTDFRYGNIKIITKYRGVSKTIRNGHELYAAKIHVNGDIIIGRYPTEVEAAVAYNKAATILASNGITINYIQNYIEELDDVEYAKIYNRLRISKKIFETK